MQGIDTSAIQRLLSRARRRIRGQWALEGATTATVLAAALALIAVFLLRIDAIERAVGIALLVGAAAVVAIGAIARAARHLDDERVARRIDRASGLADRLSTAIAFTRAPAPDPDAHAETVALMAAAIRDGVRAVPRADVALATPFTAPADLRAALAFLVVSALAAGIALPTSARTPRVVAADPAYGAPGDEIIVRGADLLAGVAHPVVALPAVPGRAAGFVPPDARVALGAGPADDAHRAAIVDWRDDQIRVRIPAGAPLGPTVLTPALGGRALGAVPFTVVDRKDPTYHKVGSVTLEPDDRAYLEALLAELRAVARRDEVPALEEFAKRIEQLLKDAALGKITKEQLLDALAQAEKELAGHPEPNQAEVDQQLAELGKQLAKDALTRPLGDALAKHELTKAKQELEKLADKLENQQLSAKDKDALAKQLEAAAKQLAQQQDKADAKAEAKVAEQKQKLEDDIRRLEKKRDEAKTETDKLAAERDLNKKKDELQKLERDQKDREQSEQRQALKRLTRDMAKAAESLERPDPKNDKQNGKQNGQNQSGSQSDPSGKQENGQDERDRQAAEKLKQAARETGQVEQSQRNQATQKKMSSQMDDLREALRRAKQKGNKNPGDPFNRQSKNQDFSQRARGGKGHSDAWKPGQGQQPGQGGQQPGQGQGQGQGSGGPQPGGQEAGVGHDPNLTGDPTGKSGNTKDTDLQGKLGDGGGGTRETILSAAQKGFATQRYRDVYGKYHQIVEEVMRTEKLPASYKYYVKRYFAKIHPSTDAAPAPPPTEDHAP